MTRSSMTSDPHQPGPHQPGCSAPSVEPRLPEPLQQPFDDGEFDPWTPACQSPPRKNSAEFQFGGHPQELVSWNLYRALR